jgi:hypothetical protein
VQAERGNGGDGGLDGPARRGVGGEAADRGPSAARGGGGGRAGAGAAGVELAEQCAEALPAGGGEEGDGAKEVAQGGRLATDGTEARAAEEAGDGGEGGSFVGEHAEAELGVVHEGEVAALRGAEVGLDGAGEFDYGAVAAGVEAEVGGAAEGAGDGGAGAALGLVDKLPEAGGMEAVPALGHDGVTR